MRIKATAMGYETWHDINVVMKRVWNIVAKITATE
jgi:hypothetical protein